MILLAALSLPLQGGALISRTLLRGESLGRRCSCERDIAARHRNEIRKKKTHVFPLLLFFLFLSLSLKKKKKKLQVYVEHDIDSSEAETPVVDFIVNDEAVLATTAPGREEVARVLSSVGFTDEMQASAVASLSGGWKMKLALARAMLMKADILLLDEPTNHLDVTNVAWLENYLVRSFFEFWKFFFRG